MNELSKFDEQKYKAKLTEYLSGWKPDLTVHLNPHYMTWRHTSGTRTTEGREYTIDITVNSSKLSQEAVSTTLHHDAIDFDLNEHNVWRDAYDIQEAYFSRLKLQRGDPNIETPFWHLWSYLNQ